MENVLIKVKEYFVGVKDEAKKVQWPSKEKTYKYTLIVIGASLTTAVFLGGADYLFTYIINRFFI